MGRVRYEVLSHVRRLWVIAGVQRTAQVINVCMRNVFGKRCVRRHAEGAADSTGHSAILQRDAREGGMTSRVDVMHEVIRRY